MRHLLTPLYAIYTLLAGGGGFGDYSRASTRTRRIGLFDGILRRVIAVEIIILVMLMVRG